MDLSTTGTAELRSTQRLSRPLLVVYTLTIFVSAGLLMIVQPLFARLILPRLGGASAVWNTAQLFFQLTLLLGYLYAHAVSRWLTAKQQIVAHLVIMALPLLVLPIAIPAGWTAPSEQSPIPALLALLGVSVGLPFFVISASSPLLQAWFSRTGHAAAPDPYFLYAASNAGSMLALLGYPFLIEPTLRLAEQSLFWSAGYALLIALFAGCGWLLWQTNPAPISRAAIGSEPLPLRRRLRWLLLAAVPSSLMLSVTTFISTDVSPFPLLWVIPLAIYLLTFMVVFGRRQLFTASQAARLTPFALVLLMILISLPSVRPLWLIVPLHLLLVGFVTLALHATLAADRPGPARVTEFFVWVSLGGALGGAFNTLLAPLIFPTILEYPLGVALAALALWQTKAASARITRPTATAVITALILPVAGFGLALLWRSNLVFLLGLALVLAGHALMMRRRPVALALALCAIGFGINGEAATSAWQTIVTERSFFGVNRVVQSKDGELIGMFHGRTLHGAQHRSSAERLQPILYYHPGGPVGQIMTQLPRQLVAVIGLGTGNLGCYARPGDQWSFFEIDPSVVSLARDTRYFTYLRDCTPGAPVILGDGRLAVAREPAAQFDLLVADAFSSDAIPVHLVTREAVELYLSKVNANGAVLFNVTNHYVNIEPVLANIARDLGVTGYIREDTTLTDAERATGRVPTRWVVIAHTPQTLSALAADPRWRPVQPSASLRTWTDDYASILSVLK